MGNRPFLLRSSLLIDTFVVESLVFGRLYNMSESNICLIARYERKLITRNKLFWIFTCFVIVGIALAHLLWQGELFGGFNWSNRALPSFIPLENAWLYNIAQGILVIFIGIDFIWRDRQLETNAVFLVRPVSRWEYRTGKVLGVLEVCLVLNVVVVGLGMIFHLLFGEIGTFLGKMYVVYMLILTFPTLLFILGVSLEVAYLLKNRTLAISVLLGLFILLYFMTIDAVWGAIDPWGRTLPLLFSDVTGMVHPERIILQRSTFLFLGCGGIVLMVGMSNRLMKVGGILCLCLGIVSGGIYYRDFRKINSKRSEYRQVFEKYASIKGGHIKSHTIYFCQEKSRIMAKSDLVVENVGTQPLTRLLLYLNPALQIVTLLENTEDELPYTREKQALLLEKTLLPGEEVHLHIAYEGNIDEAICFLDLTDVEYHDTRLNDCQHIPHSIFRHGGSYSCVGDNYTLLFPECLWYPVCVPPVNVKEPLARCYDFTHYLLKVGNVGERMVISQGEVEVSGDTTLFKNQEALPALCLSIGFYEKRSVVLDSLTLELYHFPGHDFFMRDYTNLSDSAEFLLREPVSVVREMNDGEYPFHKFVLVESPVNFIPYQRKGVVGSEFVQPEMLFYPERMYWGYYFHVDDWRYEEDERSRLELEEEVLQNMLMLNLQADVFNCSLMYNDFCGFLQAEEYPALGEVVNDLALGVSPMRRYSGMGESDVIAYWKEKSMREALVDDEIKREDLQVLLEKKQDMIKKHLQALVGEWELFDFVKQFKKRHLFTCFSFEVFEQEFNQHFGLELRSLLDDYYDKRGLPALYVRDMKVEVYAEEEETQNIGSCKVYNPSSLPAVITLDVASYPVNDREHILGERNYLISAHSCKEIRENLGERNVFRVNMNLCQNIPNENYCEFTSMGVTTKNGKIGMWDTDSLVFTKSELGIIVDNEDAGFIIHEKKKREKLAAYFTKNEEEKSYSYIYDHERWTLVADVKCYGGIVKSAYYKIAGKGRSGVEWKAWIDSPGKYEVLVYVPGIEINRTHKVFIPGAKLVYQIESEEGSTEIELLLDDEEPGWISLGKYDFGRGTYSVLLNDQGINSLKNDNNEEEDRAVQLIFADAVKWIPVNE